MAIKKTEKRIVIIPAYEPVEILSRVVAEVKNRGFFVIVIDDGSGVRFQPLFQTMEDDHVIVLRHNKNMGKGRAIKTGLSYIKENDYKEAVIVTMDADGQHGTEDAVRICEEAEAHTGTLVLGCRELEKNVPMRSRFGNTITRNVFHWITGMKVTDTQTGLRAFSYELIDFMLGTDGERYEYEMQVLLQCKAQRVPIKEIPVETIYIDGNSGSHFHTMKDSFLVYREIFRFMGASLSSFLVDYCCYCLFLLIFGKFHLPFQVTVSNILARGISGTFNYQMNRKFVFHNKGRIKTTAGQYFLLALAILILNTFILNLFTEQLGIQKYLAKVLTETVLFFASWSIQKFYIFKDRGESIHER